MLDLGSDVRRNPKISGTKHNVFGIQTGVAIGFFVREKAKLGKCEIHYAKREDAEIAMDKLAYLGKSEIGDIEFKQITPDKRNEWLNQGNPDFENLIPLPIGKPNSQRQPMMSKRFSSCFPMESRLIATIGCTTSMFTISGTKRCTSPIHTTNYLITTTVHIPQRLSGVVIYAMSLGVDGASFIARRIASNPCIAHSS